MQALKRSLHFDPYLRRLSRYHHECSLKNKHVNEYVAALHRQNGKYHLHRCMLHGGCLRFLLQPLQQVALPCR